MIEHYVSIITRRAVDDQRRRPPGNRTPRHHQALSRRRRERRHHARYLRRRNSCFARRERRGKVDPDRHPRGPATAGCRHDFRARTTGQDRLAGRKPRSRHRHRFSARAAGAEPYGAGKPDAGRIVVAGRCIGVRRSNVSANYPTFSASRSIRTRRSDGSRLANNSRSRSCTRFGAARACSFSTSRPRC